MSVEKRILEMELGWVSRDEMNTDSWKKQVRRQVFFFVLRLRRGNSETDSQQAQLSQKWFCSGCQRMELALSGCRGTVGCSVPGLIGSPPGFAQWMTWVTLESEDPGQ